MSDPNFAAPVTQPKLTMDLRDALKFTTHKQVTLLFKGFLTVLQQLSEEHNEALDKLYDKLPPEYRDYVDLADHFTHDKGLRIRKAVLDSGNDCWRQLWDEIDKYDVTFRREPPQQ